MKSEINLATLEKVRFFIPTFHINAHRQACLDHFHPKNEPTLGDIDGEAVERFWSQLSIFSHTTRNMSSANRKEQLEDAILEIRRKSRERILKVLFSKFKKTQRMLTILEENCLTESSIGNSEVRKVYEM